MGLSHIHSRLFLRPQTQNLRQEYLEATGKNLSYDTTNAAFNPQDEIDAIEEFLKKTEDNDNKTFYG